MQFSFCLILLSSIFVEYSLTIDDTELIQCTSHCPHITVSFSDALKLPSDCQTIDENSTNYDGALVCGIEYNLNYDKQQIDIDFSASNDAGNLGNTKPSSSLIQTIRFILAQNPNEPNIISRKYACNSANHCARQFYLDTINSVINQGQTHINSLKLKLHNDSLVYGPASRRRCIDSSKPTDKPSATCPNGLCYLRLDEYQSGEQPNQKIQNCHPYDSPKLFSEIEQYMPTSIQKGRETLQYTCNKNVCNRNDIIQRVRDSINEFTNASLYVQNVVSEKKSNHSICQTISSMILVLFLFLFQLFV